MTRPLPLPLRTPKLLALLLSFFLAYAVYRSGAFDVLGGRLSGYGYATVLVGGMLLSFGFTSAFGVAVLVSAAGEVHPLAGALVAAVGALAVDMAIFSFVRFSFEEELRLIRATRVFVFLHGILHHETVSERVRAYVLWSLAGIVIASPLPDEIGVLLVGGLTEIDGKRFAVLCYVLNAVGCFAILALAR